MKMNKNETPTITTPSRQLTTAEAIADFLKARKAGDARRAAGRTMNTDYLNMVFNEAMAEDRNDIFSDYNDYIMDNADPSEVTICNGDTLLEAAENEYLLEDFKAQWITQYKAKL